VNNSDSGNNGNSGDNGNQSDKSNRIYLGLQWVGQLTNTPKSESKDTSLSGTYLTIGDPGTVVGSTLFSSHSSDSNGNSNFGSRDNGNSNDSNRGDNQSASYLQQDGLGSAVFASNQSGNVVGRQIFSTYGNIQDSSWSNPLPNIGFTGHSYDSITGLTQTYARWYDSSSTRWLNEDPYQGQINDPMSRNRSLYVKSNPVNKVDPMGYFDQSTGLIQSGDSLWSIAQQVYGDGSLWETIYNANRNTISNPNLIYAGNYLTIPKVESSTGGRCTKTSPNPKPKPVKPRTGKPNPANPGNPSNPTDPGNPSNPTDPSTDPDCHPSLPANLAELLTGQIDYARNWALNQVTDFIGGGIWDLVKDFKISIPFFGDFRFERDKVYGFVRGVVDLLASMLIDPFINDLKSLISSQNFAYTAGELAFKFLFKKLFEKLGEQILEPIGKKAGAQLGIIIGVRVWDWVKVAVTGINAFAGGALAFFDNWFFGGKGGFGGWLGARVGEFIGGKIAKSIGGKIGEFIGEKIWQNVVAPIFNVTLPDKCKNTGTPVLVTPTY
jgi:RHS repeat-associated protein